mmetsp:Transcript_20672/g.44359  ORF Transcript_20672/g.44359 Transcript_20672/m.44359 type:complete len:497 (-) Transcript_20672:201-1691(-)
MSVPRCRPPSTDVGAALVLARLVSVEGGHPSLTVSSAAPGRIEVSRPNSDLPPRMLSFALAAEPALSTAHVYATLAPRVKQAASRGESIALLAHGAPASGKSSTLRGRAGEKGLCSLSLADALNALKAAAQQLGGTASLSLSCVLATIIEGGRERLLDGLLSPGVPQPNQGLQVRDHSDGLPHAAPTFVDGLSSVEATTVTDVDRCVTSANEIANQQAAATGVVRVHMVLQATLSLRTSDGSERLSQVSLIDLGGVQRMSAPVGSRGRAGGASRMPAARGRDARGRGGSKGDDPVLAALGRVIDALQEKRPYLPFRDSKLTRLLSAVLGGGGVLVALVHARDDRYEEGEAALQMAAKLHSLTWAVTPAPFWHAEREAAVLEAQIESACHALGMRRRGLTSSMIELDATSSDALLQLQSDLLKAERISARLPAACSTVRGAVTMSMHTPQQRPGAAQSPSDVNHGAEVPLRETPANSLSASGFDRSKLSMLKARAAR